MLRHAFISCWYGSLLFAIASVFGNQADLVAAQDLGASDGMATPTADCSLEFEWSTKLTFFDSSHPGWALVRDAFDRLETGMTRDEVSTRMAYLGFDESATRLRYLFVDGVGDYRPHHRAELRFRDDRLYSIRPPDTLAAPPEQDQLPESSPLVASPDLVERAMIVYLNCNGAVSDAYELARMGVCHVYCGMNRDSVAWALDPIPVSDSVDKWVLSVRERPFAHREKHLIVFDGDAVGIVFNDNDSQKPRE